MTRDWEGDEAVTRDWEGGVAVTRDGKKTRHLKEVEGGERSSGI